MRRLVHVSAILLSIASASGTPVDDRSPPIAVDVDGIDAQPHRLIVFMGADGGPFSDDPCHDGVFALYEDGLVYFTRPGPDCRTMQAKIEPRAAMALVDDLFALGFASVPHFQEVAGASDQGGVRIMVRRGRRWHAAEVYGLTRFGEVTCCDYEVPHPRIVAAVRHLSAFDVPTAAEWQAEEFAMWFNQGAYYPPDYVARAVAWPSDIPQPVLDPASRLETRVFDSRYLARARSLVTPGVNNFVTVDGTPWAFHVSPVLPEHLYREKVNLALSRRRSDLQKTGQH